jgi:hypothetical protein
MKGRVVEIDFANLTDEMKAALKEHMGAIEEATGTISFDPSEPLPRTAMEQLKISPKVDGKTQEMTVWDASQKASLASSTAHEKREAAEAVKFKAAFDKFTAANEAGQMPDADVLDVVAGGLGVTKEALVAGLSGEGEGEGEGKSPAAAKPAATATAATLDKKAIAKVVEEVVGDRLLPNKYARDFVAAGMDTEATALLTKTITEAIDKDPKLAQIRKDLGENEEKKSILDELTRMYTSTVDKQSRGRIAEMQQAGTGDITEEIPGIVAAVVKDADPSSILAKAAPQPIVLGGGEPGDLPVSIPSNEKLDANLPTDDADFEDNEVKLAMQSIANTRAAAG